MFLSKSSRIPLRGEETYAPPCAAGRVFHDHADRLYTLALLLTGDHSTAELCFVAALEECLQSSEVVRGCALSWARRIIIVTAIHMVLPRPDSTYLKAKSGIAEAACPLADENSAFTAIKNLAAFDRFSYVMSVLEGYSAHDCSILLNCETRDVENARMRSLQQVASASIALDAPAAAASGSQRNSDSRI